MRRSSERRVRRALLVTAAALLAVLPAACGSDTATGGQAATATPGVAASMVKPPVLRPGQAVPTPAGDPVLRLTGKIGKPNDAGSLVLDAATLDRLGVSKVRLFEPWLKQEMEFQGVWLADLLEVAGVDGAATTVHVTALDDYQVDLTMADVRAGGIFLATKDGLGKAIPVDDGGPTRIVFVGGVASGKSDDQWIWSLKTLDIR